MNRGIATGAEGTLATIATLAEGWVPKRSPDDVASACGVARASSG